MDELEEFRSLLKGVRDGDPAASAELCRRYGPFLRAAIRRQLHQQLRPRFDSLDFVQDVWASFLAIPAERYTFDSPSALVAFLTRVAHNKVVEVFRRRFNTERDAVRRECPADRDEAGADALPSRLATPSQWAIAGEQWERLLSQFPPGHRVIVERLREGHSNEDIARMANVSVSTVSRVVRRLKDLTGL